MEKAVKMEGAIVMRHVAGQRDAALQASACAKVLIERALDRQAAV